MKRITRDNMEEFLGHYHDFRDSLIKTVVYDCDQAKIELIIDTFWRGEVKLNQENKYESSKKKIKMVFYEVESVSVKEMFSWDYISGAYLKYIKLHNKEYLCFADNDNDPSFYCVCESIEYEEIS